MNAYAQLIQVFGPLMGGVSVGRAGRERGDIPPYKAYLHRPLDQFGSKMNEITEVTSSSRFCKVSYATHVNAATTEMMTFSTRSYKGMICAYLHRSL